jgi:hypothetical protein
VRRHVSHSLTGGFDSIASVTGVYRVNGVDVTGVGGTATPPARPPLGPPVNPGSNIVFREAGSEGSGVVPAMMPFCCSM